MNGYKSPNIDENVIMYPREARKAHEVIMHSQYKLICHHPLLDETFTFENIDLPTLRKQQTTFRDLGYTTFDVIETSTMVWEGSPQYRQLEFGPQSFEMGKEFPTQQEFEHITPSPDPTKEKVSFFHRDDPSYTPPAFLGMPARLKVAEVDAQKRLDHTRRILCAKKNRERILNNPLQISVNGKVLFRTNSEEEFFIFLIEATKQRIFNIEDAELIAPTSTRLAITNALNAQKGN